MTIVKVRENLEGQFKLWHGIITGVAVILINMLVISWKASGTYSDVTNDIARLKQEAVDCDKNFGKLSEAVLTNTVTDKQSWLTFRETTISRMAAYEANQTQILNQLNDISYQVRELINRKK